MPSSSIRRSEYDPETRILSVWFVASGKRYDYEAVPQEIYHDFQSAFAKGDHIRNRFRYQLISDE